jgi:hypothetical protein
MIRISNPMTGRQSSTTNFNDFKTNLNDFKTNLNDFKTNFNDFKTNLNDFKTNFNDFKDNEMCRQTRENSVVFPLDRSRVIFTVYFHMLFQAVNWRLFGVIREVLLHRKKMK